MLTFAPSMAEQKGESTRNLLAQLEGGWDVDERDPKPPPAYVEAAEAPVSAPSLDELDARWGDDLFGEEDDEDEEEEEDEEPEEEEGPLPDERLDPVAFAAAKKAREERASARKEKRRLKVEAKRARKKARAQANAGKQKKKTKKSRAPSPPPREPKAARAREEVVAEDEPEDAPTSEPRATPARKDAAPVKQAPPWRVIAIGAAVFVAVIVLVAALANR